MVSAVGAYGSGRAARVLTGRDTPSRSLLHPAQALTALTAAAGAICLLSRTRKTWPRTCVTGNDSWTAGSKGVPPQGAQMTAWLSGQAAPRIASSAQGRHIHLLSL